MANPFSRIGLPSRHQLSAHNRERTDSEDLNQNDQARKNVLPPPLPINSNVIFPKKLEDFSLQVRVLAGFIREICLWRTDTTSDVLDSNFSCSSTYV